MDNKFLIPSTEDLSESEEMYLAAIARIQEKRDHAPAPLSQLAGAMEILPVSANQMVRKLEDAGLVLYTPYKGVELTSTGQQVAQRILRHRWLWEQFLIEHLHFTPEESDPLACRLEHILPAEAAERLAAFLGGPVSGQTDNPETALPTTATRDAFSIPLSQARLNEHGLIASIAGDAALRSFLDLQGIKPNTPISILATSGSEILVESSSGRVVLLSARVAEAIRMAVA